MNYFPVDFKATSFIGGLDIVEDRKNLQKCRCVVGTPGRILHLIRNKILFPLNISLLVLDEADKLITESFERDVTEIISYLRQEKQVLAVSATFDPNLEKRLTKFMRKPIGVTAKKEIPILIGVKQFVYEIPDMTDPMHEMMQKVNEMKYIFSNLLFSQCLIFSNSQSKAESYANLLSKSGWVADYMIGSQDQKTRLKKMENLKNFKFRILSTTDLMARGIDVENVDLVINLEVPRDGSVYLHRVGRAGRFGGRGVSMTFVKQGTEMLRFRKLLGTIGGEKISVFSFPKQNLLDLWTNIDRQDYLNQLNRVYGIFKESEAVADLAIDFSSDKMSITEKETCDVNSSSTLGLDNIFNDYEQFKMKQIENTTSQLQNINNEDMNNDLNSQFNDVFMNTLSELSLINDEKVKPEKDVLTKMVPSSRTLTHASVNSASDMITEENADCSAISTAGDEDIDDEDFDEESDDESDTEPHQLHPNMNNTTDSQYDLNYNYRYRRSYELWTTQYWNQLTQITDYVKYCRYMKGNSSNFE